MTPELIEIIKEVVTTLMVGVGTYITALIYNGIRKMDPDIKLKNLKKHQAKDKKKIEKLNAKMQKDFDTLKKLEGGAESGK